MYANKDVTTNVNTCLSVNLSVTMSVCIAATSSINMYAATLTLLRAGFAEGLRIF